MAFSLFCPISSALLLTHGLLPVAAWADRAVCPSVLPFLLSNAGALLGHVARAPLSSPVDGCERKTSARRLGVLPELPSGPPGVPSTGERSMSHGGPVDIRINVLLECGGGCVCLSLLCSMGSAG